MNISIGQESRKKNRLRFNYNDDLALLREFVGQNPLSNPEAWEAIRENLAISTGKAFTSRTIKQHLILIIELWIKKDDVDKVRSGTEDYSERDTLLQEASGLCREFNFVGLERQKKKTPKDVQLSQLGKNVRNSYLGHQVEQKKENASTSIQQDNDDTFFQEMSTCDQEKDFVLFDDHDYVNCVDIELEPPSEKINNVETLEVDSSNRSNKRTLEIISPKETGGWMESNFENATSSENVTPKSIKKPADQNSGVPVPLRKRNKREPIRKNALSYLSEKNQKEFAIRKKELELEERKIACEERRICLEEEKLKLEKHKLDIECQERQQRMEAEKKEKELTYKILQKMMDTLVQKCNKA